jgi:hypothetical protein
MLLYNFLVEDEIIRKLILIALITLLFSSTTVLGRPYFLLGSQQEWQQALDGNNIRPMTSSEWTDYMYGWQHNLKEGQPYPDTNFLPAQLWVYAGGDGNGPDPNFDPNEPGLVMFWGDQNTPDGNYASAWKWVYGSDPDLRNSTIQVTVTPPKLGPSGQINAVSVAVGGGAGKWCQWWWSVGNPPASIPWNVPTTVTINTAIAGVAAANPPATGYASTPGFNLTQAQYIAADENFHWNFGQVQIPPPGQPSGIGMWNWWRDLSVTPIPPIPPPNPPNPPNNPPNPTNIGPPSGDAVNSKWYNKWSQPPVLLDLNHRPLLINGWDQRSNYNDYNVPMMADDYLCKDERPVTDIHWWGSFIGWTQPYPPPVVPQKFHIGIWTDVPDNPNDPCDFSHPGTLVWQNFCDNWVWNFVGYDVDPFGRPERQNEACFQFAQFLSQDKWFLQEPNSDPNGRIYWVSIASIYQDSNQVQYPFGWKTRPHYFQDDAVSISNTIPWPLVIGSQWMNGMPLKDPNGQTWDLAFELTSNAPDPNIPSSADLDRDGIVNFRDFAIFAGRWLTLADWTLK